MKLRELIKNLTYEIIAGDVDVDISGLCYDSRKIEEGNVFIAIKGFESDGHDYVNKAIEKGADVVVVASLEKISATAKTIIKVKDTRLALAVCAANFYNQPTEAFNLVGITGTNGKTSITFLLKAILKQMPLNIGIIGTMGVWIEEAFLPTNNTTPESLDLQKICAEMVSEKMDYCLMEASSHALELNRVAACAFKSAIFTNLTPDHLELHKDMTHYFEAKAKLFTMTSGFNIVNADDPYGQILIERHPQKTISYGLDSKADVYASDIQCEIDGSSYLLHTKEGKQRIKTHLPGMIYVYNTLAAAAWAYAEGIDLSTVARGLATVTNIRGRFETVYSEENKRVIIDFAHTEDSLEKALLTLRPFVKNRLIVLFGVYAAPGSLGLSKRQAMAGVAARNSDFSVVTSDNPKKQDPVAIIEDICEEMERLEARYMAIVDRKKAIHEALSMLKSGDVLLIAGKGHETTQVLGGEAIPFNEKEIVQAYMAQLNK